MKFNGSCLVIVTSLLLLPACDATYRDISSRPAERAFIGQKCTVVASLRAHGVAMNLERESKTDYVSIWNPGFTGPEMTFMVALPPGTKMRVLSARQCTNCLFDWMIEFRVDVSPEPAKFGGKPAYIRSESMLGNEVHCARTA